MRAAAPAPVRSLLPERRLRGRRLSAGALGQDTLFLSCRCGFSLPCDPTGPRSPGKPVPMAAATLGPFACPLGSRGLSGPASAPAAPLYHCGPPRRGRGLVSLTTCPRWGLPLSAAGRVVANRRLRKGYPDRPFGPAGPRRGSSPCQPKGGGQSGRSHPGGGVHTSSSPYTTGGRPHGHRPPGVSAGRGQAGREVIVLPMPLAQTSAL